MGFIFCGKHPLLMTSIQVSDPGSKGPLVSYSEHLGILGSDGKWDTAARFVQIMNGRTAPGVT